MIVPSNDQNNENKKFTIQYTKEELDKIQNDFLNEISKYIARVNNRIIKTIEEMEKEVEDTEKVDETCLQQDSVSST
jgi:gas vesicle protein